MMIMLKPNVTNWIMLHQRDFNFQVFFETLHLSKRADPPSLLSLFQSQRSIDSNRQVFNSLTIPTKDFYLNFYEDEDRYLQRANLYVVIMKGIMKLFNHRHPFNRNRENLSESCSE